MKANQAPEKLYIDLFKGEFNISRFPTNNSVEYTLTDAFIEKAKKWMLTHTYMFQSMEEVDLYIEIFIKEMKGE